jgi:hypothetical protein
MAQQTIGIGSVANDGFGDPLRTGGDKINDNFTELYTALATSAGLAAILGDETGSGLAVFNNTPTLITPVLGVAAATSINKVALTAPATGSTLTIADGKTLTASVSMTLQGGDAAVLSIAAAKTVTISNTLTFTGTDASSVAFGTGGTVAYQGGTLAQFAATTSLQLKTLISDETGSGALVFADTPTLIAPLLGTPTSGVLTNCTGLVSFVAANEASDTSCFPLFVTAATGELGPKTNAGLTFNSSTGVLTATGFSGPITGTVTGNADTVTWANEATDTTCFIGFATAASGSLAPKTNTNLTFNSNTGVLTSASAVLTTADINGGTVDGAVIGGSSAAAGTFTSLNANGGGALTGTWTNLGSVTTIDINGGTVDGAIIGGASAAAITGTVITANTSVLPDADGGAALGSATLGFTILGLSTGATINIANGNWLFTHSSGIGTVTTGDLRVTNNFTDAASVVTIAGAQTLTNKTLTSPTLTTPALGTPSAGVLTSCTGLVSFVVANEATDTTCFPLFVTAATGELGPKTVASFTLNSNTGALGATSITVGNTGLTVGASAPFSDSAGTLTLQNVDALDATTEATIEAAIDTLANLTSVQGRTVTLADAGFDVIMAWDDSASAYKNMALADLTDEATPAAGDYILIYGAEGDLRRTNWSELPGAGGGIAEVSEDLSPQLGGDLDANLFDILFDTGTGIRDESDNEQLIFVTTASAVNYWEMTNSAAGGVQRLAAAGGDAAIAITIASKSTDPINFEVNGNIEASLTATAFAPGADGGNSLGTTALGWQNLFGNTGFVFNLENGDWVATHTAGILTVGTGDLRVTTAGTNAASVVTVGGTQTLTNKSLSVGQVTGLGTGVATFLATPSYTNLAAALTGSVLKTAGVETIWIPAGAMKPKVTSGAGVSTYDSGSNDVTIATLDFDTTTQEYAHTLPIGMPKSWNEGTVTAIVYWTNTGGASTETVRWSVAGAAVSNDDTLNVAMGTAQTVDDTWLAQNDLHITAATSAITIGGSPAAEDLVVFEITRVTASDNMAGDAKLIGIKILLTTDATNDA